MNHEEATKYLDDLADRVPDRRPPVGDIVRAGKIAQRRNTQKTASVITAAAVLVVGGGLALQQWTADGRTAREVGPADIPTTASITPLPNITPLPGEAPVGKGPCPPAPTSTTDVDRSTVPAPDDAEGLTANGRGTFAAWFEPTSGPLPFLVVYDLTSGKEVAREDLGVIDDLRSASLRIDDEALYYRSSADARVWLRYQWGVDDFPSVFVVCR